MREKDAVSREYFSDPYHFAQICNNALFKGKKLIQPEKLTELDPEELKNMGIKRGKVKSLRKSRDLLKLYDSELFIAVLGIENQSDLHYGMPLKNLLYDALNYESQRCKLLKEHRIKGDLNKAEYISGFGKEDRLIPVITLVIYYGDEPWTGGKTLHDILDIPEGLKEYEDLIADYRINLLEIRAMENLDQYEGELKALLGFVKYKRDKEGLKAFVKNNEDILEDISMETVQAISVLGEAKGLEEKMKKIEAGEEQKNMKSAWQELVEDWKQEGRQNGILEGRTKGRIEGGIRVLIEDNLEEGVSKERILEKLQKRFSLSKEEAQKHFQEVAGKKES